MTDASDDRPAERAADPPDATTNAGVDADGDAPAREEVEEKYDFENFGPREMAEMSYEEWQAAFDHDSWITGGRLLDRAQADLENRVADRDVFAVLERIERDGEQRLLAYSDEGYAVVSPDGTVEGRGTVLRDVKPSVALASMDSYEVPDPPQGEALPDPAEVPEGSGQLGNKLMQVIAAVHFVAGVGLLLSGPLFGVSGQGLAIAMVAGIGFLLFSVFVFLLVANARLSDRFRAEEYRNRLRAVGVEDGERPAFLTEDGVEAVPDDAATDADAGASDPGVSAPSEDGD